MSRNVTYHLLSLGVNCQDSWYLSHPNVKIPDVWFYSLETALSKLFFYSSASSTPMGVPMCRFGSWRPKLCSQTVKQTEYTSQGYPCMYLGSVLFSWIMAAGFSALSIRRLLLQSINRRPLSAWHNVLYFVFFLPMRAWRGKCRPQSEAACSAIPTSRENLRKTGDNGRPKVWTSRRSQPNFAWTVGRLWPNFVVFYRSFQFSGKTLFLAAILARGVISCVPHTSFDEINYSVVNSERGELVRGSDPPLVCSAHSTAGDLWRAPIRLLLESTFGGWCVENWGNSSLSSPNGRKTKLWENLTEDHRTTHATSHALGHGSRGTLRRCHLHSCGFVRNEEQWPWVVSISRSKVNRVWWTTLIKAWWKSDRLTYWIAWGTPFLDPKMNVSGSQKLFG